MFNLTEKILKNIDIYFVFYKKGFTFIPILLAYI